MSSVQDFKDAIVDMGDACTSLIEQYSWRLYQDWFVEQGHVYTDADYLKYVQKKATQQTMDSAIELWTNRVRYGKGTPPPSDIIHPVPSALEFDVPSAFGPCEVEEQQDDRATGTRSGGTTRQQDDREEVEVIDL